MLRLLKNRKAQNTVEYALLFAIVIGAFSAMQLYVRRNLNAKIREGADNIPGIVLNQAQTAVGGEDVSDMFSATQYEPYYVREGASESTSTESSGTERGTNKDSGGVRELEGSTSHRTGSQTIVGAQEDEF